MLNKKNIDVGQRSNPPRLGRGIFAGSNPAIYTKRVCCEVGESQLTVTQLLRE